MLVASIPSPSSDAVHLGPLAVHWYGIFIATATLSAAAITKRRFVRLGGDGSTAERAAVYAVIGGVIGARLWHVVTQMGYYRSQPTQILNVWEGGLAIYGALIGGALGLLVVFRKSRTDFFRFAGAVAPALPFAQAIGRLGNYFNQELFGKPTSVPWSLRIDPTNRPIEYLNRATFHPVFLYEALLNIILGFSLLYLERKRKIGLSSMLPMYLAGYAAIRFAMELVRIDRRYLPFDWTINGYISAAIFLIGSTWSVITVKRNAAHDLDQKSN